ncbi:hypothetical protein GCM10027088_49400 [Nocardia goodfellowii]
MGALSATAESMHRRVRTIETFGTGIVQMRWAATAAAIAQCATEILHTAGLMSWTNSDIKAMSVPADVVA